jgi:uncharacterized protein
MTAYICAVNKNQNKMEKVIAWVEIPANDFNRAVKFYNNVFKWKLEPLDFGTEKMACFPSGEGTIFQADGYKPSSDGTIVSFTVPDSIEETIIRIEHNNGEILIPKTKIEVEGRGYFASFIDSEGNRVGLYENL